PGESFAGEWPGPFLTTIILASLVFAPVLAFWKQRDDDRPLLIISLSMLLISFGVVFSLRGGLGYVFSYTITSGIRAQERVMPFLTSYALVILCLAWGRVLAWKRWIAIAAAPVILVALIPGMKMAFQTLRDKQAATLYDPAIAADFGSL